MLRISNVRILILTFVIAVCSLPAFAQWKSINVGTTASFRGLSVVDRRVIWASGTLGTVVSSRDGGNTWKVFRVPGADKLDFRDIEAFDANTAYILSIGNGPDSRIYKTTDGGATWKLQFENRDQAAFFDAIACWDRNICLAMSDPVDGRYRLIATDDGGLNWRMLDAGSMPSAAKGEAAFAASGTCLIARGKREAYLVSGGTDARVFRSTDRGRSWSAASTPMIKGTAGSGIFSITMRDAKRGAIAGGDFEKPSESTRNLLLPVTAAGHGRSAPACQATVHRSSI
jgi:photosystem II stability/assembly factor-like uncharacterized protein